MIVVKFNKCYFLFLIVSVIICTSCFECAKADTICPSQLVFISTQDLSNQQPSDAGFEFEQLSESEYQIEFLRDGMHEVVLQDSQIAIIDVTFTNPDDSFSCCDNEVGIERLTINGVALCNDFVSCHAIEI